jgi:putative ABC transport system permease protein
MRTPSPPNWIFHILSWFCPPHLVEEIEGDLTQKYFHDLNIYSRPRAGLRLFIRTLMFFRPGIILRSKIISARREAILFQNHLFTAIRQMQKHKVFSFITIFALSTSITACLLIFQYASFELSYDRYYNNASRIYRLNLRTYKDGILRSESATTSIDALPEIRRTVPGIQTATQFITTKWWFNCSFTYREGQNSRTFNEGDVAYTTPEALKIFDINIKSGNANDALVAPFTMIISESAAIKYFGDQDAIGKVLHLRGSNDEHDYTVTAVMEDPPMNSHYRNDMLLSFSSTDYNKQREFFTTFAYILLDDLTTLADVQQRITAYAAKLSSPANTKFDIYLEPVTDIHLYSVAEDQFNTAPGQSTVIYFLLAVAFIVLALAWINYVNLSIARSFGRAKEVGVRKTAGATSRQIASQFLSETFVYNVISILIAVVLVAASSPWFYDFVGIKFPWDKIYWAQLGSTGWIVTAVFFCGMFVSGFLPARLMASLPTISVLKGKFTGGKNSGTFRRASVVFQFSCTIALLMAVIAFNRQLGVMKNTSAGIDFKKTMIVLSPSNADSSFHT